jgi:hypothetical protein
MHADSITNDANLQKLYKEYRDVWDYLQKLSNDFTACKKTLSWLHLLNIKLGLDHRVESDDPNKIKQPYVIIAQTDFFKLIDFLALLRLKTERLMLFCKSKKDPDVFIEAESYWDEFDVQPFRNNLFATHKATLEINRIFANIGINDYNTDVNNYKNQIEFYHDSAIPLLELIGYWVYEFEYIEEDFINYRHMEEDFIYYHMSLLNSYGRFNNA